MEKYENYWQTDASKMQRGQYATVDQITVQYIVEDAQKVAALQTSTTSMSQNVPPAYIEQIQGDGFAMAKLPGNDVAYLEANMSSNSVVGGDLNLRLAIFYAISSADAATIMGSVSNVPVYTLGCPVFPDYNSDWETWDNYQTSAGNLFIMDGLYQDFLDYHTIQMSLQKQNPGYNPDGYVFCQENGQPYEPRTYQDLFKRCVRQAGIPDANFHSLRHTFATRALEQGMDVVTLSRLLEHATPSVTLDKYGHALDDHKRTSVEKLGGVYSAGRGIPRSRER